MASRPLIAATILVPSANLCVPAVLVAEGVYEVEVLIFSWSDHLIYISSCVDVVPIVVSVPKNTKCLSGVDTKVCVAAVGALATIVARVDVAPVASESHSNVAPSVMVAMSLFP